MNFINNGKMEDGKWNSNLSIFQSFNLDLSLSRFNLSF